MNYPVLKYFSNQHCIDVVLTTVAFINAKEKYLANAWVSNINGYPQMRLQETVQNLFGLNTYIRIIIHSYFFSKSFIRQLAEFCQIDENDVHSLLQFLILKTEPIITELI